MADRLTNERLEYEKEIADLKAEVERLRGAAEQTDKIARHPTVQARAGVGDGAVGDAVISVCGALHVREHQLADKGTTIARLTEAMELIQTGTAQELRLWGVKNVAREGIVWNELDRSLLQSIVAEKALAKREG